jgi:hypothetical protein
MREGGEVTGDVCALMPRPAILQVGVCVRSAVPTGPGPARPLLVTGLR